MKSAVSAIRAASEMYDAILRFQGLSDQDHQRQVFGHDKVGDIYALGCSRIYNSVNVKGVISIEFRFGEDDEFQTGIYAVTAVGSDDCSFVFSIDGVGAAHATAVAETVGLKIGERMFFPRSEFLPMIGRICNAIRGLNMTSGSSQLPLPI